MLVKINDLDHFGRGITKIDNITTFVKNALPKEEVDIEITKEKRNFKEAIVLNNKTISKDRRKVKCPYYNLCGGCNIMHMNYDAQLRFKKDKIKNILFKYAGINVDIEIEPSNNEYNYRNKITLHKNGNKLGYKKEKTGEIINIDECLIADNNINKYLQNIKVNKEELVIRTNGNNVISSEEDNYLIMNINDLKFRIDINSFFQVNSYICSKVFDFILENTDSFDSALDLYSGVCTLGILISTKGKKVYSIEINKNSYENAKENIKLNNINNVVLMNGKVEEEIKKIDDKIDLVVCDPPRSGMDDFTIDTIIKMKPKKIIYMSCEPITLARDLNLLKKDYCVSNIKAFDMFPNTYHCEVVTILEKK